MLLGVFILTFMIAGQVILLLVKLLLGNVYTHEAIREVTIDDICYPDRANGKPLVSFFYKLSKDKEKFLRGFESEISVFEAAAREIKNFRIY